MEEVGVRELKIHASEIVRKVREERVRYTITYRGKPVGVLMPVDEAGPPPTDAQPDAWEELVRLGEEIGRGWKPEKSSVEIISEMRR
jgi:prevent-host-death family protein